MSSANFPHASGLSSSLMASYTTQSNLENLIAQSIMNHPEGRRRSSAGSQLSHHRPMLNRNQPSVVNEANEETALLDDDESRNGDVFDDMPSPSIDVRSPSLSGQGRKSHGHASSEEIISAALGHHQRRSSVFSALQHPFGGGHDRRPSTVSNFTSSDRNKLARLTSIVSGGAEAADHPHPDVPGSPRSSRSLSRTRLAAGRMAGFSPIDVEAAAITQMGANNAAHAETRMLLDPAEELDPVEDLGLAHDAKGELVHDKNAMMWAEFKVLIRTAAPIFFTQVAEYSLVLASVISIGHLSTIDLAAASLASMTASVTAFSILQGMASALDTLLPAAWTSAEPHRVGYWVQRMLVVMAVAVIPMYFIWFNAENLLLLLRQDPAVAMRAAQYLRYLSIGIPGYAVNLVMRKYFQSQNLMSAPTIVIAIVAPLNALLNYLLVWGPDKIRLGFVGAPLATAVSFNSAALVSVGYAVFFAPRTAWPGFSRKEAFTKLGTVTSLGLAGTIMVSSEWWAWELCSLMVSMLGPVPLAVNSILLSFSSVLFQIPQSGGIAAAIRTGNLLGAGRPHEAKMASRLAMGLSVFSSAFNSALLIIFKNKLAYIFNNDPPVVQGVADLTIYVALFQVADGLVGSSGGVLRAVGKQSAGALINLTAYYVLALPLGAFICFNLHRGLAGLWIGLATGLAFAGVASALIILTVDWNRAVEKTRERLGLSGSVGEEGKGNGGVANYGTMGGH